MDYNKVTIKTITLAYFSGTGGTKAIVDCFEKQLIELDIKVDKINIASTHPTKIRNSDMLILFSPVYAFRLASIVENWMKRLPKTQKQSAAIISVSGGGEISPNTACRVQGKRLLKQKGYRVIYEKMLIMPSNFATQAEKQINLKLLSVMPKKVSQIIADLLSGKKNLTTPKLQDRFFASIGKAEHLGAKFFGVSIHASKQCNQCGLCVRNCPNKNIKMKDKMPKFGFHCLWCLKCIYACPQKALSPRILKFAVLKDGFNIDQLKKEAQRNEDTIKNNSSKNSLWKGVIDYIKQ